MFNCPEPNISRYFIWKRYIDVPIALFLSVFALPLIGLSILLVRISSRGPGIYKQVRLGLDGKPFVLYKIRSMRADAEAATGAVWAPRNDRRITPFGRLLRRTHFDELPQLYNVLKGDIALVGPRPERPEFVTELEKRIDGYAYRLYIKPGLTGLAQLNFDSDLDLNDVRRKLILDFDYIEHCSVWFDLRILFCTVLKTLLCCGPRVLQFFRLFREAAKSEWAATLLPTNYASAKDEERLSKILFQRSMV